MKEIFSKLVKSLDLSDGGFSFRKLLSLVVICLVVYMHIHYVDGTNVLTAILYDFGFICVLLGLLNIDKFIDAKYGGAAEIPGQEPKKEEVKTPAVDNPDA